MPAAQTLDDLASSGVHVQKCRLPTHNARARVYVFRMMLIYIHGVTFVQENGLLKRYTDVCTLPHRLCRRIQNPPARRFAFFLPAGRRKRTRRKPTDVLPQCKDYSSSAFISREVGARPFLITFSYYYYVSVGYREYKLRYFPNGYIKMQRFLSHNFASGSSTLVAPRQRGKTLISSFNTPPSHYYRHYQFHHFTHPKHKIRLQIG